MKRHPLFVLGIGVAMAFALIALIPSQAVASPQSTLAIRSQLAIYNPSTGLVTFRIVFNRSPDFFRTDELGRQADSFQYFVGSDVPVEPPLLDSIIRGEEIHSTGLIPIRNAFPPDPTPGSGGWGTIRGEVPFTLHGPVLSFSAPLSLLTDRTGLSVLPYILEAYEFGIWNGVDIVDHIVVRN
jgi:hypothetical protein